MCDAEVRRYNLRHVTYASIAKLEHYATRICVSGRIVFIELTDGHQIGFPADRPPRRHGANDGV